MKPEDLEAFKQDDRVMARFMEMIEDRLPAGVQPRDHFTNEQLQSLLEQAVFEIHPDHFTE